MKRWSAFVSKCVAPAFLCCAAALALTRLPLLTRVEDVTLDERTRWRARWEPAVPADEIALLAIDEVSLRDAGRWPWPRAIHGDLMQLLSRARPAVVVWDILFTEETADDSYLAAAIAANRSVVLGAKLSNDEEEGIAAADVVAGGARLEPLRKVRGDVTRIRGDEAMRGPTAELSRAGVVAFVDTPPSEDGVRRSAPLVVRVGDAVFPTLSLRALMEYWGATPEHVTVDLGRAVVIDAPLARREIPIDETGSYQLNFRHGVQGFVRHGYTHVLHALATRHERNAPVALTGLTGRILLVGQVADGLADLGPTPFSPLTPLVLIHANIIENVLREDYVRPVPAWLVWGGCLVVCVYGLWRYSDRTPLSQWLFAIGAPVAFVGVSTLAWFNHSRVVPLLGPLMAFGAVQTFMIGRRMLTELRAKEQIKGMFGTYVSPELVSRLIAAGQPPQLGGHEAEITAFFSDIEGFSTFSEVLPPAQLVELMNEYLTACTDIVQREGGTLDKYVGDMIVAMYGAPVPLPDHAFRACRATLLIQQRLGQLRAAWGADHRWPAPVARLRTRIGVNTGPAVIGNMGSRTRFNYTMMGDNVNLAARLESAGKTWGVYAMCSEATRQACVAHSGDSIVFRALGRLRVKGRAAAVPVYEIAGFATDVSAPALECFRRFEEALACYYSADWARAETCFRAAAMLEPEALSGHPTPSLVYLDELARRRAQPPRDWDGVFVMTDK